MPPPQSLNPLPYPVIFANCLGWTVYAMLKHDWFVYLGSVSGIAMGLLFITSTLPHTPSKASTRSSFTSVALRQCCYCCCCC